MEMDSASIVAVLNRLLRTLTRSLPTYLQVARPWSRGDGQAVQEAMDRLVADQQLYAQRVADAIMARGGRPDPGPFPLEFAAVNDLSLEFLLRAVIRRQRRDLDAVGQCAAELADEPELLTLAEEVWGNTRGHLEILEEIEDEEARTNEAR